MNNGHCDSFVMPQKSHNWLYPSPYYPGFISRLLLSTTPVMIFSHAHICKGLKLDAWRSQSLATANCQHDTICQSKRFLEVTILLIL